MSSGRAGLPGWWSPQGAGGRAGRMPEDADIRQPGFQAHSRPPAWPPSAYLRLARPACLLPQAGAFPSAMWQESGMVCRGLMPSEAWLSSRDIKFHRRSPDRASSTITFSPKLGGAYSYVFRAVLSNKRSYQSWVYFGRYSFAQYFHPRQSGRYLDSSHSSREIPACLKTFMSRSTLMSSPRCELGMTTESSSLAITSCFDPGNGPSNANFLNLRISSLLETGVSLFDNAYRLRRNYN